jgi:2-methylcitrate dehydratase PrpD
MSSDSQLQTHAVAQSPRQPRAQPAPPWHRWQPQLDAIRGAIAWRHGYEASPDVSQHARRVVLDTLGCTLAGRAAPEVQALEAQSAALEPGAFHFPGGQGLGLRAATQILAVAPTWYEDCEGHAFAHGRPGIATLAALLPLALQQGATVGEFINAYALGYEVGARAGGWLRVTSGVHVDGNWPGLGAAAGVAALLKLPPEAVMAAVDIAACQLPASLYLPIRTGASVRNVYLAHSASLGLDSALAAQAGVTAPPDALAWYAEHLSLAAQDAPPAPSQDLLLDAYLKPFAAVRHVHYGAIAAGRVRERLQGDYGAVQSIELTIYEEGTIYCNNPQPQTLLAAQFSLSFGLAAALRFGGIDASVYQEPQFSDAELRRLEALVQVRVDPQLTASRQRGAHLRVTTHSATFEEQVHAHDAALLLDTPAMVAKFAGNAASCMTGPQARHFCEAVLSAAPGDSLSSLWQLATSQLSTS